MIRQQHQNNNHDSNVLHRCHLSPCHIRIHDKCRAIGTDEDRSLLRTLMKTPVIFTEKKSIIK